MFFRKSSPDPSTPWCVFTTVSPFGVLCNNMVNGTRGFPMASWAVKLMSVSTGYKTLCSFVKFSTSFLLLPTAIANTFALPFNLGSFSIVENMSLRTGIFLGQLVQYVLNTSTRNVVALKSFSENFVFPHSPRYDRVASGTLSLNTISGKRTPFSRGFVSAHISPEKKT